MREYSEQQLLLRISKMIDVIVNKEEVLKEIDKPKLLETILRMLSNVSVEWDKVSDEELSERIRRILILEAMSGMLNGLKPEQIENSSAGGSMCARK